MNVPAVDTFENPASKLVMLELAVEKIPWLATCAAIAHLILLDSSRPANFHSVTMKGHFLNQTPTTVV